MAYQAGTSSGQIQVTSYSEGDGFGVTGGQVRNQSLLAAKVAPPNQPESEFATGFVAFILAAIMACVVSYLLYFFLALFGYDLAGKLTGMFSVIGLTIWWTILFGNKMLPNRATRENQYNASMRVWKRSWICLRCGKDWQPRLSSTAANIPSHAELSAT